MKNILEKLKILFNKKSEDVDVEGDKIYIKSIDELDQYLHESVMAEMKGIQKSEKVHLILNPNIYNIGIENLFDILMMKSMHRCMNDPEFQKYSKKEIPNDNRSTEENGILSILTDDKSTLH
jgi:DNA modification methylase